MIQIAEADTTQVNQPEPIPSKASSRVYLDSGEDETILSHVYHSKWREISQDLLGHFGRHHLLENITFVYWATQNQRRNHLGIFSIPLLKLSQLKAKSWSQPSILL